MIRIRFASTSKLAKLQKQLQAKVCVVEVNISDTDMYDSGQGAGRMEIGRWP